jgi:CubicO group peptidase (beta-lactamase class C family)
MRGWAAAWGTTVLLMGAGLPQTSRADGAHQPLTVEQRRAIDRYVTAEMARERIPGLELGIYRGGLPVLEKGYGQADLEWQAPVTPQTLMQSGSVGKQFTATAVMMLVEQGKVDLDDSITRYFPDAPDSWKPIKVKNLLSHTSGLAEYEDDSRTGPDGPFYLRLDFTDEELLHKVEALPIEYAPGSGWDYRNTNYLLLGFLIHKVTGQFYGDYLHDHIFAPLGMTSTRIISDTDIIPGRASGYEIKGGKLRNQAFVSSTFNRTADGTLYFNVRDLQRWDQALYGERLIKWTSLQKMWTPFVLDDGKPNPANYGFGWFVNAVNHHRVIEHSGAWQGFTTEISRYVDDKLTVVVLTNLDAGHARPGSIERVVAGLVEPGLMPPLRVPIADDDPTIAKTARRVLLAALSGADLKAEAAAKSDYKFDPDDAPELRAALPPNWDKYPMVLVVRRQQKGVTDSGFKIGPPGDTRIFNIGTDASGKLVGFLVRADPDNR